MRRREFITLLGGVAAAWPLAARAQEHVRRIGVLMNLAGDDAEGQAASRRSCRGCSTWAGPTAATYGSNRWAAGDAGLFQRYAEEILALARSSTATAFA
jgi:putative tryptophan/tyrosine transport system substrate-binding protein